MITNDPIKTLSDSKLIWDENLTRFHMPQSEAVEVLMQIQPQWTAQVLDKLGISNDPITTDWWVHAFGEWPCPHRENTYLMTWPQAGGTWLVMDWDDNKKRVEIGINGTDSTWLLHIRTQLQLVVLLHDLLFRKNRGEEQ